jgi:3-hydroxyacyl-[acyl-carrier-protein] dehydratase
MINIEEIMTKIPHRYPFLLIDRVIDVIPDQSAIGIKNVTINEPHFTGHFPNKPVMPGVLIIEAMAQTSAVLVCKTLKGQADNKLVYFMSIEEAKFRKIVSPGDQLFLHVTKSRNRGNVWKFTAEAKVDGAVVAEAIFSAMIVDK